MDVDADRQQKSASLQDAPEDLSVKETKSVLRQQLDAPHQPPSGLSLLVAALDAQNSVQHQRSRHESAMDSSNSEASISPSPSMTADSSGGGGSRRRCDSADRNDGFLSSTITTTTTTSAHCRPVADVHKDETYWEKRRRNNDAAKRSREKRRLNDMVMEQRLLELSKENNLLKSELHTRVLPPSPVVVAPKIEPALPTATTPLLFGAGQSSLLDLGAPAAKVPNLSLITGASLPPTTTNNQHLMAASQIHPSLLNSVLPPHSMLQLYQAQIQAALAAQQSRSGGLLSVGSSSAFQPFSGHMHLQQQHVSPDSSTVDPSKLTIQTTPAEQSSSLLDGKQYLRYKLLERQNRRSSSDSLDNIPAQQQPSTQAPNQQRHHSTDDTTTSNNDRPQSLLGSLLSNRRSSPSVLQSRTERESGLASSSLSSSAMPLNNDLKHCLSSLAVHLTSGKSDSSHSGDSMASPSSSRGAESTNSSQSHPSPSGENGAILQALRSTGPGENGKERYTERRKRNNEAAKRCRANRRALFEFRFKRTQQLEQENTLLRDDIQQLTKEVLELKEQLLAQRGALPTQGVNQQELATARQQEANEPMDHSTSPSADSGHHDSGSEADDGAKLRIAEST